MPIISHTWTSTWSNPPHYLSTFCLTKHHECTSGRCWTRGCSGRLWWPTCRQPYQRNDGWSCGKVGALLVDWVMVVICIERVTRSYLRDNSMRCLGHFVRLKIGTPRHSSCWEARHGSSKTTVFIRRASILVKRMIISSHSRAIRATVMVPIAATKGHKCRMWLLPCAIITNATSRCTRRFSLFNWRKVGKRLPYRIMIDVSLIGLMPFVFVVVVWHGWIVQTMSNLKCMTTDYRQCNTNIQNLVQATENEWLLIA